MKSFRFIVLTNPTAGKEAEFNRWYDEQHLPDVLKVPGFVAAQRFKLAQAENPGWTYLAIYEFESDDPEASLRTLSERVASAAITISPALDRENMLALIAEPIGETLRRG